MGDRLFHFFREKPSTVRKGEFHFIAVTEYSRGGYGVLYLQVFLQTDARKGIPHLGFFIGQLLAVVEVLPLASSADSVIGARRGNAVR